MFKEGSLYNGGRSVGGEVFGGVCWRAQGRWLEVRGATLAAFLAGVNFCGCAPHPFFSPARLRNKD